MSDRKARLAALAAKAGRTKKVEEPKEPDEEISDEPVAKKTKVDENEKQPSILEQALEKAANEVPDMTMEDIETVNPRKINWDLKRDIQPKLDKLEKRTQRAIVELLKERLQKEAAQDID